MKLARVIMLCVLLVQIFSAHGQGIFPSGGTESEYFLESIPESRSAQLSIRPKLPFQLFADSSLFVHRHDSVMANLLHPLISTGKRNMLFARVEPLVETGYEFAERTIGVTHAAAGLTLGRFGQHMNLWASARVGKINPMSLNSYYVDSLSVLPGLGLIQSAQHSLHFYFLPEFRYRIDLVKNMKAETGFSTHFFGNGKRSLILSDEHYPYPYFKLDSKIWKLRYVNLFAWHRDVQSPAARTWRDGWPKFYAMHYLAWDVSKKFEISVFEAVVCPLHDSLMQRQFVEYNYLLPLVMYRPVDYSIGSPDNVLAGLNLNFKPFRNHIFYAQMVFDELFMNEFRADILHLLNPDKYTRHGAWVNKQSYQVGWRYYNIFGVPHFNGLLEFNAIRPYTYSHRDVAQNYTHLNQPLAHPYGANLYELTGNLRYGTRQWYFCADAGFIRTGIDTSNTHFGQNIFQPTFDAHIQGLGNIPVEYYGNTIGQGVADKIFSAYFSASRLLFPKYNIWIQAAFTYRHSSVNRLFRNATFLNVALQWGVGVQRKGW